MSYSNLITPKPLVEGDTIAILSPATSIKPEYIEGARSALENQGFKVKVMPHAFGPSEGSYASSEAERLEDLISAFQEPEIRAILCARGGYGCAHLIDRISAGLLENDPKWLIGFSDISVLHAMMRRASIRSIHSSMAKHLTLFPAEEECNAALLNILTGGRQLIYNVDPDSRDIVGEATGELRGGNLAVLDGLVGTPYDILLPREGEEVILFIEDIGEAIYRTERMVRRLALSGALSNYKGIIVGRFTESNPDRNYTSTADMLRQRLPEWGAKDIPIAFNFPTGHTDRNLPIVEGSRATLTVTTQGTRLVQQF